PAGDLTQPMALVVARRGNYVLQSFMMSDAANLAEDATLTLALAELQWDHLVGAPGPGVHPPVLDTLQSRTGWCFAFMFVAMYGTLNGIGWLRERVRGVRAVTGIPANVPGIRWLDIS